MAAAKIQINATSFFTAISTSFLVERFFPFVFALLFVVLPLDFVFVLPFVVFLPDADAIILPPVSTLSCNIAVYDSISILHYITYSITFIRSLVMKILNIIASACFLIYTV